VRADRRALEHVLGNLIDNAVKYCPDGASVNVGAAVDDGVVRVSVTDTGPCIAREQLARIFERFYRVDAGRSRELGGTGLGLSIVKHLIEAMDGHVSVESTVGSGSKFSFTLHRA
jgi:two-component system phosphate regulon sensor histidine kinase PhoR